MVDRLVIIAPEGEGRTDSLALAPDRFGRNGAQVWRRLSRPCRDHGRRQTQARHDLISLLRAPRLPRARRQHCRRSSRAPSRSTPRTAPAPIARAWARKLEIDPDLHHPRPRAVSERGRDRQHGVERSAKRKAVITGRVSKRRREHFNIDLDKPVSELTEEQLDIVLYGTGGKQVPMHLSETRTGNEFNFDARLRGRDHQPGTPLPRDQLRIHPREDLASS
ncbi:MAG: hypothetical protein MZV64_17725 [Ignavibacteriales bacterium]|nr:hypothetical protein [Ignavibacteriales bacterium]